MSSTRESGRTAIVAGTANERLVIVRGAGDLASGVIARLFMSGFPVMALEAAEPLAVRRGASFSEAVREGRTEVEGIVASRAGSKAECRELLGRGLVPILVDPDAGCLAEFHPLCLVDAIMAKGDSGTRRSMAPIVIGLGPGYAAGREVDAVVETMRGHDLGRVILEGKALPDTGCPGEIGGKSQERVLRAPRGGRLETRCAIGDRVDAGALIATIRSSGGAADIRASFRGMLRGILPDGMEVEAAMKVGDIDPRCELSHCFTISDKARAVAGGVLEALLHLASRLPAAEDGR